MQEAKSIKYLKLLKGKVFTDYFLMYWKFTDGVMPKLLILQHTFKTSTQRKLKKMNETQGIYGMIFLCVFKVNIHVDMLHSGKRALLILDEKINKLIRKHSNYELYKCYKNPNTRLQV